jgi:CelD/BcsL family acetyltransferase involved in cellulose biosynthesis
VSTTRLGLRAELVADSGRLAELAGAWDALAEAEPLPFGSHWWLTAWWEAFGGDALRVWVLWDGDELAAALPLHGAGRGWAALANVHTPVFRPLARDASALDALLHAAFAQAPGRVSLPSLPAGDLALDAIRRAVAERGGRTLDAPRHVSPIVDTTGDFEAWRAGSRPRWGAPLERFRRKMGREHELEQVLVEIPRDLEGDLARGLAVEASGWKGRGGTAVLSAPETAAFYTAVTRAAAAAGELRMSWIALDGDIVAWDLCLLRQGRLYLLKTAFDERARRLAPGLVMRLSVIERCFELGLDAHELLGDDTEWKRKFSTTERRHVDLEVYGRRPGPAAEYVWRAGLRPRLKRLRDAARRR